MVDRGKITLLDVLSRIPPPSPPKIEHTADWLLSETDAQKVRTKLQSLADGATPAAPAESKPESKAETESQFAPAILDGEPRLQKGKNTRAKVDAWVKWSAKQKVMPGDTGVKLAERIQLETKKWGYLSDRTKEDEHISVASIVKMLPPKVTGGYEKKRRKLNK